jgi:hypothetical protein
VWPFALADHVDVAERSRSQSAIVPPRQSVGQRQDFAERKILDRITVVDLFRYVTADAILVDGTVVGPLPASARG